MKTKLIKILLLICLFVFETLSASAFSFRNMTLDFIHISDTHISDRTDTSYKALSSSKALLKDAINQINDIQGIDFVLFTGDMVDYASKENYHEYYKLLTKLKYPTLNSFGNHDFSSELPKEEVLKLVKTYNPNYVFSDTYYAFSPKTDYRIIILDPVIKDEVTANGLLDDEQLQFLERELSQNTDKIIVIALHHPSLEPFKAQEHSLLNADKMNEILIKYKNPIIVLSGHYHATKLRHIGNIVFVSTPSMVTYPMGFRHIKITNYKDRVDYKFEFISTRLDDVKELNRQNVISYGTLAGLEKDRNSSFITRKSSARSIAYKRNKIKHALKDVTVSKRELKKLTSTKTNVETRKVKKVKEPKIKEQKIKEPKVKVKKVKEPKVKPVNIKQPKEPKVKIKKEKVEKPKKEKVIKEKTQKKEFKFTNPFKNSKINFKKKSSKTFIDEPVEEVVEDFIDETPQLEN